MTKPHIRDLALRSAHTFWQSFIAVLGVTWAASGLNVSTVVDVDSAKRFALAALGAALAAALSAVKTTVRGWLASRGAHIAGSPPKSAAAPDPSA